jgi:hypothetical protein
MTKSEFSDRRFLHLLREVMIAMGTMLEPVCQIEPGRFDLP